jgi:hypothetical protein
LPGKDASIAGAVGQRGGDHPQDLTGLVVSGLVYWAFSRSLDLTGERAAIEASDRELEELAGQ